MNLNEYSHALEVYSALNVFALHMYALSILQIGKIHLQKLFYYGKSVSIFKFQQCFQNDFALSAD